MGTGYEEAIKRVEAVRLQRQPIYGDDWKKNEDWEILAMIKEKVKRTQRFVIDRRNEDLYENRVDTLIDLVNYSLFLLQNELDKKNGEQK